MTEIGRPIRIRETELPPVPTPPPEQWPEPAREPEPVRVEPEKVPA